MFEKEAEEIANKRCHEIMCFGHCSFSSPKHHRCGEWHREYNCAKEGIEYGFKECAKSRLNVTTISDCPIKDEWHYVKDEKPKELNDVLCFVVHNEHRYVLQGYLRDGRWILSPLGTYLNNDDVIAWKEIVLPELKESE